MRIFQLGNRFCAAPNYEQAVHRLAPLALAPMVADVTDGLLALCQAYGGVSAMPETELRQEYDHVVEQLAEVARQLTEAKQTIAEQELVIGLLRTPMRLPALHFSQGHSAERPGPAVSYGKPEKSKPLIQVLS